MSSLRPRHGDVKPRNLPCLDSDRRGCGGAHRTASRAFVPGRAYRCPESSSPRPNAGYSSTTTAVAPTHDTGCRGRLRVSVVVAQLRAAVALLGFHAHCRTVSRVHRNPEL